MANEISVMNIDDTDYKIKDNDVRNMLTREFLESNSYNVGDAAIHEGKLYECTETTTGAWDATKWKETTVEALVKELEVRAFEAIGILSDLRTQEKGSLVGAVNELVEDASSGTGAQFMEITGDTGYTSTVDFIKGLVQGITVVAIADSTVLKNELSALGYTENFNGTLYVVKYSDYRCIAVLYEAFIKKSYYMVYRVQDSTSKWIEVLTSDMQLDISLLERFRSDADADDSMHSGVNANFFFDLSLSSGEDINDKKYSRFGFYSGSNLANAPTTGWFNFLTFPLNGNPDFPIQIGYSIESALSLPACWIRSKGGTDKSWVSWKEVGGDGRKHIYGRANTYIVRGQTSSSSITVSLGGTYPSDPLFSPKYNVYPFVSFSATGTGIRNVSYCVNTSINPSDVSFTVRASAEDTVDVSFAIFYHIVIEKR